MTVLTTIAVITPKAQVTEAQCNHVGWVLFIVRNHVTVHISTTVDLRALQTHPVFTYIAAIFALLSDIDLKISSTCHQWLQW